jgi:phage shock protein C
MDSSKKLYKSRHDKMIDGVCAGMAEYFGVNTALVRILFVLFGFFGGSGIIAYITAMILVPPNPDHVPVAHLSDEQRNDLKEQKNVNHNIFWGIVLILVGGLMFLDELDLFEFRWFWHHFPWDFLFPAVLILAGVILIVSRSPFKVFESKIKEIGESSTFRRKSSEKKVWGVCSGIAEYSKIDVSIIRILWVVLTFVTFPLGALAYILIAVLTPDEHSQMVFSSKTKES